MICVFVREIGKELCLDISFAFTPVALTEGQVVFRNFVRNLGEYHQYPS